MGVPRVQPLNFRLSTPVDFSISRTHLYGPCKEVPPVFFQVSRPKLFGSSVGQPRSPSFTQYVCVDDTQRPLVEDGRSNWGRHRGTSSILLSKVGLGTHCGERRPNTVGPFGDTDLVGWHQGGRPRWSGEYNLKGRKVFDKLNMSLSILGLKKQVSCVPVSGSRQDHGRHPP